MDQKHLSRSKSTQPRQKTGGSDVLQLAREAPPSSKGQIRVPRQWYPGAPILYTSSAGSVLATSLALDPTVLITNWATRFKVFQEFRILSIRLRRVPVMSPSATTAAVLHTWFDESSNAAPTYTASAEQVGKTMLLLNANSTSFKMDVWTATDMVDLGFIPTSGAYTPVYAKQYTDNNWGFVQASSQMIVLIPEFLLEFRGLATV